MPLKTLSSIRTPSRVGRRRFLSAFAAMLCCVLASSCVTPSRFRIDEKAWIEVTTPNFVIWTTLSESGAVRMAQRLELFRSVAAFVVGRELPQSRIPTKVIAFRDERDFHLFSPNPDWIAFFQAGLRGSLMVTSGPSASSLHHEYVHYLTSSHTDLVYPKWYEEGFAEFLGSTGLQGEAAVIGQVVDRGPPALNSPRDPEVWTTLEDLFAHGSDASSEPRQFYHQSWAFVHYMYVGPGAKRNPRARIARYVLSVQDGTPISKAVKQAFGVSVEKLDANLRRYVKAGRYVNYSIDRSKFAEAPDPTVRALEANAVALELAALAMDSGYTELASRYFENVFAADPSSVGALRGRAMVAKADDEVDRLWRVALGAGESDPITHLEYANSVHARAASKKNDAEETAKLARLARRHYVRSWKLDDSNAETYAQYGRTFLLKGQKPEKGRDTLNHALRLEPGSLAVMTALAALELAVGDHEAARARALRVYGSAHGGSYTAVTRILEETGGMPGAAEAD